MAAGGGDLAAGADPLAGDFLVGLGAGGIEGFEAVVFKGREAVHEVFFAGRAAVVVGWWGEARGHGDRVVDGFFAARVLAHEGEGCGEDWLAALAGLHGSCCKGFAFADVLDVVEDGDGGVAGEDEVAVHAVDSEV